MQITPRITALQNPRLHHGHLDMTKTHDWPLTPPELFRRGIEITQEIRGRIEESRAYYLGRSSREPVQPLSEVFDPMRGPSIYLFRIATKRSFRHLARRGLVPAGFPHPEISRPATGRLNRRTDGSTITKPPRHQNHPRPFHLTNQPRQKLLSDIDLIPQ